MNTPLIGDRRASVSVRSPIIVNQLGAEVRASLIDHWSRPWVIDHPADRPPWEIAPEADVLLTRPMAGWSKASVDKPAGWPYGLRVIQTASRLLSGVAARRSACYRRARHLGRRDSGICAGGHPRVCEADP